MFYAIFEAVKQRSTNFNHIPKCVTSSGIWKSEIITISCVVMVIITDFSNDEFILDSFEESRQRLKDEIAAQRAITLDFWTDEFKRNDYLNVNVQWMSTNMIYKRTICVKEFISSSKTAENVREELLEELSSFEIDDLSAAFLSPIVALT